MYILGVFKVQVQWKYEQKENGRRQPSIFFTASVFVSVNEIRSRFSNTFCFCRCGVAVTNASSITIIYFCFRRIFIRFLPSCLIGNYMSFCITKDAFSAFICSGSGDMLSYFLHSVIRFSEDHFCIITILHLKYF